MSKVQTEVTYMGPSDKEFSGIDGEFMRKNKLLVVVGFNAKQEGAVMLHPDFDPSRAQEVIPVLTALYQQSVATLHAFGGRAGQVH